MCVCVCVCVCTPTLRIRFFNLLKPGVLTESFQFQSNIWSLLASLLSVFVPLFSYSENLATLSSICLLIYSVLLCVPVSNCQPHSQPWCTSDRCILPRTALPLQHHSFTPTTMAKASKGARAVLEFSLLDVIIKWYLKFLKSQPLKTINSPYLSLHPFGFSVCTIVSSTNNGTSFPPF